MAITPRQLEKRSEHMGFSDIARCLTGHLAEVVASKIYPETVVPLKSNVVRLGDACEPYMLAHAESELGRITTRNLERRISGTPILGHLDGIVADTGEPVECKTHGLLGPSIDEWGEANTADVPYYTLIQVQLQCRAVRQITPVDSRELGTISVQPQQAHVAAWLKRGPTMFCVPYDMNLCAKFVEYGCRVWEQFIEKRILPEPDFMGWADLAPALGRLSRHGGTTVPVDKQTKKLIATFEGLKSSGTLIKKLTDAARAELLYRLEQQTADGFGLGDGTTLFCKEQSRAGYMVKPTTFATLRITKNEKLLPGKDANGKENNRQLAAAIRETTSPSNSVRAGLATD